jgi:hypothetical protein
MILSRVDPVHRHYRPDLPPANLILSLSLVALRKENETMLLQSFFKLGQKKVTSEKAVHFAFDVAGSSYELQNITVFNNLWK